MQTPIMKHSVLNSSGLCPPFQTQGSSHRVVSNITTGAGELEIVLSPACYLYFVSKNFKSSVSMQNKMFNFSTGETDSYCVSSECPIKQWLEDQNIGENLWFQVVWNVKIILLEVFQLQLNSLTVVSEQCPVLPEDSSNFMQLDASLQRKMSQLPLNWLIFFQFFWCLTHCSLLSSYLRYLEILVARIWTSWCCKLNQQNHRISLRKDLQDRQVHPIAQYCLIN